METACGAARDAVDLHSRRPGGDGICRYLDRIRQDKAVRIAYRGDAPPFSYKDNIGEPAGYMVDLCRAVAKKLAQQLNLTSH